jgi:hypothetical protein
MRSQKLMRSLLPGVRRLLAGALNYAARLADFHPMVLTVTQPREDYDERAIRSPGRRGQHNEVHRI